MKFVLAFCLILLVGLVAVLWLRRTSSDGSETFVVDGMKIRIGPAQEMSGPAFLEMLASRGGDSDPNEKYLYIQIADPVTPIERGSKYEEPIDTLLRSGSLGKVTGGGSMMNADGSIKYVGLDVTVYDFHETLPAIAAKLREIGAPEGTVIRYDEEGSNPLDIWENR